MSVNCLNEARRVMTICNSCRYCEGFCAVFPAMELRRTFTDQDLKYFANLCHNCRDCYYACQYAPPHTFDLNVPKSLAKLRLETYEESAWPGALSGLFRNNGRAVLLTTSFCVLTLLLITTAFNGISLPFETYKGENIFYQVLPYKAIVSSFTIIGLMVFFCLIKGFLKFWKATGESLKDFFDLRANIIALGDVLRLKYLDGGGYGCNYPNEKFSMIRRNFHHGVFYGFMLCFASTTIAAFYDHFLSSPAPYPFFSLPVLLGTTGGISIVIGCGGLLFLKEKMDRAPADIHGLSMDVGFVLLLFLTSFSGLLLLLLRATPFMGVLLIIHVGIVAAFFILMPYGKFIHGILRYAALVKNAREQLINNTENNNTDKK